MAHSRTATAIDIGAGIMMMLASGVVLWPHIKPTPAPATDALVGKTVSMDNAVTKVLQRLRSA